MPFAKEVTETYTAAFNLTRESVLIGKNIVTSGEIPVIKKIHMADECTWETQLIL